MKIGKKKGGHLPRMVYPFLAVVILCLLAGVVRISPWYANYMEKEQLATCEKVRFVICDRYHWAVDDATQAGEKPEDINYEKLLRQVVLENFETQMGEDLTCDGLCRSGGHYSFRITEDTHDVYITCDVDGHGEYTF